MSCARCVRASPAAYRTAGRQPGEPLTPTMTLEMAVTAALPPWTKELLSTSKPLPGIACDRATWFKLGWRPVSRVAERAQLPRLAQLSRPAQGQRHAQLPRA